MSKYTEKDSAKDTNNSVKETRRTWHGARDDAARSGHLNERRRNKVKDSPRGPLLLDFFDAIFGFPRNKKNR